MLVAVLSGSTDAPVVASKTFSTSLTASRTSPSPDGVKLPVCADDVPLKATDRVTACAAGAKHTVNIANAPDNSAHDSGPDESLNFIEILPALKVTTKKRGPLQLGTLDDARSSPAETNVESADTPDFNFSVRERLNHKRGR